jgi:metallo-beta-lactamase family protein
MQIEFYGAAQTVTGSQHLLTLGEYKILLDCGLFQGRRSESQVLNREIHWDAASLDAVILSHAHIDHSGNLPTLVKHGFKGSIYATPATRDLCAVMLMDSAMIQMKDAEHLLKHKGEHIDSI